MQDINRLLRTPEGAVLCNLKEDEIANFKGDYITVINDNITAVANNKKIATPKKLTNEIGIEYLFVGDFNLYGKQMAQKHGIFFAFQQDDQSLPSDREAKETSLYARKDELCEIPRVKKVPQYKLVGYKHDADFFASVPDKISRWVYSDANIFSVLDGKIQFLSTPMINITDPFNCQVSDNINWW